MKATVITAVMILSVLLAQSNSAPGADRTVYFLGDNLHRQWCGYASESQLKAHAQAIQPAVVGGADYKNGRLSVVHIVQTDESGDWAVNDDYVLDANGKIRGLTRTINVIPEDNSEEQTYRIEDGKAIKERSSRRELRTGKATTKEVGWFRPPAVVTNVSAFPFSALIAGGQQAVWSTGEACFATSTK